MLEKKIIDQSNINNHRNCFVKYLNSEPISSTLFLKPVTDKEIIDIVCSLKNGKSPGNDCISNNVIKRVVHILCKPLRLLFNLCLQKGIFPTQCKVSQVTPVFKSGENNMFCNYRPISLLNCFSKILERCIYNRLINFFDSHKVI